MELKETEEIAAITHHFTCHGIDASPNTMASLGPIDSSMIKHGIERAGNCRQYHLIQRIPSTQDSDIISRIIEGYLAPDPTAELCRAKPYLLSGSTLFNR